MIVGQFAGTSRCLRLAVRRDRLLLPIWIVVFVVTAVGSAQATKDLYPTVESRYAAATAANETPALVAIYGRITDVTSLGELSMLKLTILGSAMLAVLLILMMTRHTRAEEESGRLELVAAGRVGRFANLAAALILCTATSILIGLATAIGLTLVGLPAAGAAAFGAGWAGVGIVFTCIAGVTAQLARTSHGATATALAVLAASYLLRAIADATPGAGRWLGWLSPLGQMEQIEAFAGNNAWALAVMLAVAGLLAVGAFALNSIRDLGTGVIPERSGPSSARRSLRGPLTLLTRLQRGQIIGWLIAFGALGLVLGSIATAVPGMTESAVTKELFARLGGTGDMTDAFVATEMAFVGFMTAAFAIQVALRVSTEERLGRSDAVLSANVGRPRWLLSSIAIALAGSTVAALVAGTAAGLSFVGSTGDSAMFGPILVGAVVQLPAVWILMSLTALLFGLVPRFARLGWALLVGCVLLGELGPLFQLDDRILQISPFAHVPRYPLDQIAPTPIVVMVAVAVALLCCAVLGYRRRDIRS